MTRALPRTNFHSSKLIRCLAELAIVDSVETGNAFAEKLGLWIHFTDAITLSAICNDSIASSPKVQPETLSAIDIEFGRIQARLINSIMKSCSPKLGKTHLQLPAPVLELPIDVTSAYAPYRWFYQAHQRDMEASIPVLRSNVRKILAKASPRLKKLADMDETFEKILRDREGKLLATVPILLKNRFVQLFKTHQQVLSDTQKVDDPADWMQSEAWLARFCNDMQILLLSEVELRLQPTLGLIEAFHNQK